MRIVLIMAFFVSLAVCEAEPSEKNPPKPNLILLMGDDHGWEETGYNGHPYVKTPYLDEMAKVGLRLDNFYAQPSCSPTRGSVLTGRHPNRYGIFRPGYSIRPEEITVAHLLRDSGYATAHFGKWHVGPVKKASPTNPGAAGFDEWLSHDNFFELDPVFSRNGGPPQQFVGESSEIIIDEAITYIEGKKKTEEPFFTVIWFGSPHEPYSGLEKDLALYRNLPEKYSEVTVSLTSNETGKRVKRPLRDVLIERYAEITAMDRSIGTLRTALKNLGLRENTLLWYCGDNGTPPSGLTESRFRGLKGKVYENGIRVPGVIEWPKGIPEPQISTVNAVTSDILPTVCALAGAKTPDIPLDGIDLTPILDGKMKQRGEPIEFWNFPVSRDEAESAKPYIDPEIQKGTTPLVKESRGLLTRNFTNYHHPEIRENDFKGDRAILTDDHKLVINGEKGTGIELFDLKKDIGEKNNLAETHPDIVQQLSRELRQWQESVIKSLMGSDYPAQEKSVTIGLFGDSTVAEQSGWGPAFAERFDSRATVLNYAKNGATLQALSKKLDELVALKPDFVLIQFGHNDQKRYVTSVYSDHLRSYVNRIRKSGGKAVIVSSVTRRSFDENGKIVSNLVKNEKYSYKATLTDYANAAESVAKELNLPFIDLHRISIAHHNKIGREESMTYNFKEGDMTHFNQKGAEAISNLLLKELKTQVPEFATFVSLLVEPTSSEETK